MLHPNSLFGSYKQEIERLKDISKTGILSAAFALQKEKALEIFYAPHNEYINEKASILIVGITPGWSQTERAYHTARAGIEAGMADEEICRLCKLESRFAGAMRKNLIAMLDALGLQEKLQLSSCGELFSDNNELLHTTSMIKYPCFYRGANYSGHAPSIASSKLLSGYVHDAFMTELQCLANLKLIIPLGSAVETALRDLNLAESMPDIPILWGFPHPSGLNARRSEQFAANLEKMRTILTNCK